MFDLHIRIGPRRSNSERTRGPDEHLGFPAWCRVVFAAATSSSSS